MDEGVTRSMQESPRRSEARAMETATMRDERENFLVQLGKP
jgi:hypothetical protein